jgi:hypothetical protein
MEPRQTDVMGLVDLAGGQEVKVVTDIDDRRWLVMRGDRSATGGAAPERTGLYRLLAFCRRSLADLSPRCPGPRRRGRASRSAGRVADPGVALRTALAILSHTLAGSLGDHMRTPALLRRAPGQVIVLPFVPRIGPRHYSPYIAAASRPLTREAACLQHGTTPRAAVLTAYYRPRPNQIPDGHIRSGGGG